ncbi:MAG: hypothetical protein K2P92_03930 [Bdellovibrionaceae bacterium]|nr:hypothetical protein [Pseudobdellovibrionaceae bacterium]
MSVQAYSQDLQILVQELSKTNPNEKVIKNKTDLLGIPYSPDLIILMSEVLVFLSKTESKKSRYKEKAI